MQTHCPNRPRRLFGGLAKSALPIAMLVCGLGSLHGQALYWYGADDLLGGNNTWDNTSAYWLDASGQRQRWSGTNTARAILGGSVAAPFTLTVASYTAINTNALEVWAGYTIDGGNGSSLNFIGATPAVEVDSGIVLTTKVQIGGTGATLRGGGTWQLGASHRIGDDFELTVAGNSTFALGSNSETIGTLILESGHVSGSGTLTATNGFTLLSGTVDASLAGNGRNLYKTGTGTVVLNGSNSYSGETAVLGGTLQLGASNRIANGSALRVDGGTFSLGSFSESLGAVSLVSGRIDGTTGTLTGSAYNLESGTVTARLRGTAALTKSTSGLVELAGANSYTGATTITGGDLRLTGSLARTNVTVEAGGTFSGTGSASRSRIYLRGTIAPGSDGIGALTTGRQDWYGGGAYEWQIADALGSAGTGWDLLTLGDQLSISSTTSSTFTLKVIGLDTTGALGAVANFDNSQSYSWTILQASSVSGFAANRFTIDASAFAATNSLDGGTFSLALTPSGTGINLVFTPVPEPRTYAAALGLLSLGFAALKQVRRRRTA